MLMTKTPAPTCYGVSGCGGGARVVAVHAGHRAVGLLAAPRGQAVGRAARAPAAAAAPRPRRGARVVPAQQPAVPRRVARRRLSQLRRRLLPGVEEGVSLGGARPGQSCNQTGTYTGTLTWTTSTGGYE